MTCPPWPESTPAGIVSITLCDHRDETVVSVPLVNGFLSSITDSLRELTRENHNAHLLVTASNLSRKTQERFRRWGVWGPESFLPSENLNCSNVGTTTWLYQGWLQVTGLCCGVLGFLLRGTPYPDKFDFSDSMRVPKSLYKILKIHVFIHVPLRRGVSKISLPDLTWSP